MDDIHELLEAEKILKFAEDLEDAAFLLKFAASSSLANFFKKMKALPPERRLTLSQFLPLVLASGVGAGLAGVSAAAAASANRRLREIMKELGLQEKRRAKKEAALRSFMRKKASIPIDPSLLARAVADYVASPVAKSVTRPTIRSMFSGLFGKLKKLPGYFGKGVKAVGEKLEDFAGSLKKLLPKPPKRTQRIYSKHLKQLTQDVGRINEELQALRASLLSNERILKELQEASKRFRIDPDELLSRIRSSINLDELVSKIRSSIDIDALRQEIGKLRVDPTELAQKLKPLVYDERLPYIIAGTGGAIIGGVAGASGGGRRRRND